MIIKLEQIQINAHLTKHYTYEKSEFQDIFINVAVEIENCNQDALDKTLDYAILESDIINFIKSKQFVIIEQIANEIADIILTNNMAINTTVEVGKNGVLENSKSASITVQKSNGNKVFLALGSNIGDRLANIQNGIKNIQNFIKITKISSMHETVALLPENAPKEWNIPYINAVICGFTKLDPYSLLGVCKLIEGNKNNQKWSPRQLDIDIIWYNNQIIVSDTLTIPHLEFLKRDFVLKPMQEIAPEIFV